MRDEASILPLRISGLSFRAAGASLLRNVSLTVPAHRSLIIVGPNGAGKSLLLRLCHGLLKPDRGEIHWNLPEQAQARQAMVFQKPVLLRRSVRANLEYALSVQGLERKTVNRRSEVALSRFGLQRLSRQPARTLSGGEQQRLAMARAWVLKPQILFLDEPTSQLDPGATRQIEAMIAEFTASGVTIMMATHDLAQARRLADSIAFLDRGELVETGPAEPFFTRPASAKGRAFIAGELLW